MPSEASRTPSVDTLASFGRSRLTPLCRALDFHSREEEILGLFDRLVEPWGAQPVDRPLDWHSHVVDDGTPFEFSVAFGAQPELRIMVEPIASRPSLRRNADAAVELLHSLSEDYDVALERFNLIRDLFVTDFPSGAFSIWVAACIRGNAAPDFKLYLCPEARGPRIAPVTIEEAMVRLGFPSAWGILGSTLGRRGPDLDEFKYFSLDLQKSDESRVKVYARHQRSTPEDLEVAASACPAHRPGEVRRFLQTVAPDCRYYDNRAPFTCYAFVESEGSTPAAVTTHFPINGYVQNDAEASERIRASLDRLALPTEAYDRLLTALTVRPLDRDVGLQSYASFRRHKEQPRLTVYLPTEAYLPGTVAPSGVSAPPSGILQVVPRYEPSDHLVYHPFIRRFEREPFHRENMWTLLANLQVSEEYRARRLRMVLSKTENEVTRRHIARLFAEELGGGTSRVARHRAYQDLMTKVTSWRPKKVSGWHLAPGRALDSRLIDLASADCPLEALGALVAEEVFRRQMSCFLREQLMSYSALDPSLHGWLTQIDDHFDPAEALAAAVTPTSVNALWRGSEGRAQAEWSFLNDLYGICYCG